MIYIVDSSIIEITTQSAQVESVIPTSVVQLTPIWITEKEHDSWFVEPIDTTWHSHQIESPDGYTRDTWVDR